MLIKIVPSIIGSSQKEMDQMIKKVSPYVSLVQLDIMDGMREQYKEQIESNGNFINSGFFKKLAGKNNLKLKIIYISNRFEFVRNLFGNFFASEVIGIFSP